jgi:7-cyano-7-deazaguanine synthase
MTKADIVRAAVAVKAPLELTWSCYDPAPDGRPCGACDSCRLRAKGFEEAGLADPAL